jgi:hypothetical protein
MITHGLPNSWVKIWTIGELCLSLYASIHGMSALCVLSQSIIDGMSPNIVFVAFFSYGMPGMGLGSSHRYNKKVPRKSAPVKTTEVGDVRVSMTQLYRYEDNHVALYFRAISTSDFICKLERADRGDTAASWSI